MAIDEERIEFLMRTLKISREEAIDLEAYDEDVDKGRKTEYDLTPEQVKIVQDMTRKTTHKKHNVTHRERKPNEVKEAIVAELAEFLSEKASGQQYSEVVVTNISRMIHFCVGEKEFDLQLIEKRAPKK